MANDLFKAVYLLGWIAGWMLRRPHFGRLHRQGVTTDSRGVEGLTRAEKLLGLLGLIGTLVIPVVYVFAPWLDFANHHLPAWAGAVGAAVLATGLWLQWRARVDLGHNLTPTARTTEAHSLVTGGAYRHIRHPIYAGHWLAALAQALLLHNSIAGLAGLILILPMYVHRVRREEQNLLERFGEEYRRYMDRTGRVIPVFWR